MALVIDLLLKSSPISTVFLFLSFKSWWTLYTRVKYSIPKSCRIMAIVSPSCKSPTSVTSALKDTLGRLASSKADQVALSNSFGSSISSKVTNPILGWPSLNPYKAVALGSSTYS